jgi:hypothetical protein
LNHWLQTTINLLEAETYDLRELAKIAGAAPETFYVGARLDGVNLKGQDLRGMQFTNLDIRRIEIDDQTLLDPVYQNKPSEHVERGTSVLADKNLTDEWSRDWLNRWRTSNLESRPHLADEAVIRLRSITPDNDQWSSIWMTVWMSERRNSLRRIALYEVAILHIGTIKDGRINWLNIWQRLWKHAKGHDELNRIPLKLFLDRTIEWFGSLDYTSQTWAKAWRQLWKSARTIDDSAARLTTEGLLYIDSNPNHESWGTVWRDLWEGPNRDIRASLLPIAISWLTTVDVRHMGWAPVWRRVWKTSTARDGTRKELQDVAEWWLEKNIDSYAWSSVWLLLVPDQMNRRQLSWHAEIAMRWLPRAPKNDYNWPRIWAYAWDVNHGDRTILTELYTSAIDWLGRRLADDGWVEVWKRASTLENAGHLEILQAIAEVWRKHHSITEHAFRLRLEILKF